MLERRQQYFEFWIFGSLRSGLSGNLYLGKGLLLTLSVWIFEYFSAKYFQSRASQFSTSQFFYTPANLDICKVV